MVSQILNLMGEEMTKPNSGNKNFWRYLRMRKIILSIFLCALLAVSLSGHALASTATVSATLDMTSVMNASGFTWGASLSSATSASVNDFLGASASQSNTGAGWSSPASTATIYNATASGSAANAVYTSFASVYDPNLVTTPYAIASAGLGPQTVDFNYQGSSNLVHFEIPYTVMMALYAGNPGIAWGQYTAFAGISSGVYNEKKVDTGNTALDGGTYVYNLALNKEIFTFDVPFTTYDTTLGKYVGSGFLSFGTEAQAYANGSPVPIPGAVWLLGTGLVGLVGIRRRKIT
jgi:hypothetical protein